MGEHSADKKPNQEIWRMLYEKNARKWYYMALKIVQNEADAEDIVQTCMVRLANNFERYKDQPFENLEKLCSTIVINSAHDIMRQIARRDKNLQNVWTEMGDEWEEYPDVLTMIEKRQNNELLRTAISRLKAEDRYWLYLQYGLELEPREIGVMKNLSAAAVRKKVFNSRNRLAKILEEKEYEDLRHTFHKKVHTT